MKKIFLLFTTILFASQFAKAQMVMGSETFDGTTFPPAGWLIKADSTPALNVWRRLTTGTNPTCSPKGGAAMARFSSRAYVAGAKQQLISRPIDYTNRGTSTANITFWMYRDSINTNYDSITVWVNNADSIDANAVKLATICRYRGYAIPDTQVNNGWRLYSFAVPTSYTGNANAHFIFEGTSQTPIANTGAQMFIDQLTFEEYPIPCTGTPNVGNVVVAKPLICGGTGNSNLNLSAPIAASGLSYMWQSATSAAGPWTTLATTASANTGTITSSMYYNCVVTCSNSSLSYTTPVDSVIVSNNPLPTITVSPSPATVCPGSTGVSITANGGSNYLWVPNINLNTNIGATVIATPTANTQYTIVGADANGCTNTTTVNVILGTSPTLTMTATPNDSLCIGAQVVLNCVQGNTNGLTYLWNDGVTSRRDTIIVTTSGMHSVVVTNAAGCSATDSILITALPPQTSGFSYTNIGNTYTFVDTTSNAKSWKWTLPGGLYSNSKTVDFTFPGPGTYTITLVVNGPCKLDTITKIIEIFPLSITNYTIGIKAVCYPNPANNFITISTENEAIENVMITNVIGQKVSTANFTSNQKSASIIINHLPKGIYNAHITTSKGIAIVKFVKE